MINLRQFPQRLEISFWTALIHIMSKAPDFSWFFLKAGDFAMVRTNLSALRQALFWSVAGLFLGFAFGLLSGWISSF